LPLWLILQHQDSSSDGLDRFESVFLGHVDRWLR
jgi:hypothetical protein